MSELEMVETARCTLRASGPIAYLSVPACHRDKGQGDLHLILRSTSYTILSLLFSESLGQNGPSGNVVWPGQTGILFTQDSVQRPHCMKSG
jgi:hypothetical protein